MNLTGSQSVHIAHVGALPVDNEHCELLHQPHMVGLPSNRNKGKFEREFSRLRNPPPKLLVALGTLYGYPGTGWYPLPMGVLMYNTHAQRTNVRH